MHKYTTLLKSLDKAMVFVFVISIFLFKIPNFYLIPSIYNSFLTTQSIARVFIVAAFIWKILKINLSSKKIVTDRESEKTIILLLLLFMVQSLSIFSTININAFFPRYKDVIIGIIAFFTFYLYKNEYKKIILAFILSVPINIVYETLLFFKNTTTIELLSTIVYQKHFGYVLANLQRGRIFTETYDEITIPFLLENKSKNKSVLTYILIAFILSYSYLSNFRSRILMFLISIGGSLIAFEKTLFNKKIIMLALVIIIVGFLAVTLASTRSSISFLSRVTLQDTQEDINSIVSRGYQIENAADLGLSNIFGVGFGNYYDNINKNLIVDKQDLVSQGGSEYIHNIFGTTIAETGYISLIILLFILLLFIKSDYHLMKRGTSYQKAFIISFWSLFGYALFNPTVSGSSQVLFWGLRGVLLK